MGIYHLPAIYTDQFPNLLRYNLDITVLIQFQWAVSDDLICTATGVGVQEVWFYELQ